MPNIKKHAAVGAIIGAVAGLAVNLYAQYRKIKNKEQSDYNLGEALAWGAGGAAAGTIGAALPDLIEPAKHSHHRKLFHSVATGSSVVYGLYKTNTSKLPADLKHAINCVGLGYLSHLAQDSETPRGIPVVM
jgi:membrane-bound metal-dependent hydrolase YbcI (DUF457 family)